MVTTKLALSSLPDMSPTARIRPQGAVPARDVLLTLVRLRLAWAAPAKASGVCLGAVFYCRGRQGSTVR